MNRRIERLRRLANRWLGRRVEVERFVGPDLVGVIVRVERNFLVLRIRRRGQNIRIRISFRNIRDIELAD
ncbi:acetyl-CoA acetyltransferase [Paenibacillus sp. DYY-L-2]|uniref:acetyl-CoA acetyltransferase n=1 Tax=Paenibacillus sp. DYY-L-2 TaxID=3447013 RepID=UPI003F4F9BAC